MTEPDSVLESHDSEGSLEVTAVGRPGVKTHTPSAGYLGDIRAGWVKFHSSERISSGQRMGFLAGCRPIN